MTVFYDPVLVLLSIFVAITGALTGLAITAGYGLSRGRNRAASLIKGAIVIGGSIWAMHFVAMLAVQLPVLVSYSFVETVLSLYIAILGTWIGLFLVSGRRLGFFSVPFGGLLMGVAIGGMHYLGMSAMRGCGQAYNQNGVIASLVIAVVASAIALWFTFRKRAPAETLVGGLMLGLTIASMHYTAMVATTFNYLPVGAASTVPLISQGMLAYVIASAVLLICGVFLLLFSSLAFGSTANPAGRHR